MERRGCASCVLHRIFDGAVMERMACPIGILLRIFFSFVVAGRDVRRPETAACQGARAPTHKVSPKSRASSLRAQAVAHGASRDCAGCGSQQILDGAVMERLACPICILLRISVLSVFAGRQRAPTRKVSPETRASSLAATGGSSWSVEVVLVAFCIKFSMERSWS